MFSQVSRVTVWAASRVSVSLQHLFPRFLIPLVSPISQTWNSFRFMCRYYQWQKVVTAANMAFRSEIFESQVSLWSFLLQLLQSAFLTTPHQYQSNDSKIWLCCRGIHISFGWGQMVYLQVSFTSFVSLLPSCFSFPLVVLSAASGFISFNSCFSKGHFPELQIGRTWVCKGDK